MIKGSKHTLETITKQQKSHKRSPSRYWLGKKRSPEDIEKISKGRIGKGLGKRDEKWRLNISKGKKGVKFTDEHIKNLSLSHKGQKGYWTGKKRGIMSEEQKEKVRQSNLGKHFFNNNPRYGVDNNKWKGGITRVNEKIRRSRKYREWRTAVFTRDNYTCVWCGFKGYVHADHIKPFAYFPELRFEITNGRTLCVPCHKKTDTYKGKGYKRK